MTGRALALSGEAAVPVLLLVLALGLAALLADALLNAPVLRARWRLLRGVCPECAGRGGESCEVCYGWRPTDGEPEPHPLIRRVWWLRWLRRTGRG